MRMAKTLFFVLLLLATASFIQARITVNGVDAKEAKVLVDGLEYQFEDFDSAIKAYCFVKMRITNKTDSTVYVDFTEINIVDANGEQINTTFCNRSIYYHASKLNRPEIGNPRPQRIRSGAMLKLGLIMDGACELKKDVPSILYLGNTKIAEILK